MFVPHLTRQRKFYAAFFLQIAGIPQGRDLELTMASSYIYVAHTQARFVSLATFKATDKENKTKACILNVNPASWTGTYLAGIYSMSLKKLSRRYSAQQNVQLQIILQLSQTLTNPHNTASLLCVLMRKRIGLEMAYICSLYLRVQVGHNALEHKCTIHVLFFLFIWQQQKQ